MQNSSASPKKSFALAIGALAGAASLVSAPAAADAAPFLTVSIWARLQGSGDSFSQFGGSGIPGNVMEYEIRVKLGAEDSVNPYAGATAAATTTTISNWVPSNGSTSPTSGLTQVRFHLAGSSSNAFLFNSAAVVAPGWADSPGNSGGVPAGDRLDGVNLIRAAGNFAGVAPDESLETLTLATGVFTVGNGANLLSKLYPTITGGGFLDTTVLATMRWRNDANSANVNYNSSRLQQTNSTTGTAQGANAVDPIIIYEPWPIPEPGAVGIIALGALACRRRRRCPDFA